MRKSLALSVLLIGIVASIATAQPVQWPISAGGNGHWYEKVSFTTTFYSWSESRDLAAGMSWNSMPGYLVTLTSAEENSWVWNNLSSPYGHYLGGYQLPDAPEPDVGWGWVTGEPWVYENWAHDEPNETVGGAADCLSFHGPTFPDATWDDAATYNIPVGGCHGFIVEYEPLPVPTETTTWGAIKSLYR